MAKPELTEWDTDLTAPLNEEYAALVRAIRYAQGFSLLFVQCSPAQGEELIARVRGDVVDKTVDVLRLESEVDDLYNTVAALPHIDKTNVLFISGLEKSLVPYIKPGYGSEGDYYAKDSIPKILGRLNLQRESFRETFRLCFVFLVPLYAMKYLIRRAADFFDWRSGVWKFVGSADDLKQESHRLLKNTEFEEYLNLTTRERRERFLVIEDLLVEGSHTKEEQNKLRREQGRLLDADQDFESAVLYYDAALAFSPDDHYALYNKGAVLADLGRYEEAIASYDAALAIKPDTHEALNNKGDALVNLGSKLQQEGYEEEALAKLSEGIACYDAALAIKPDYQLAINNRKEALEKLG